MCVCVCMCVSVCVEALMLITSVWTLNALAEGRASKIWAGRLVVLVTGPHLTPGRDTRWCRYVTPSKGKYQKHGLGRKIPKDIWRPALSQVKGAKARAGLREAG